MGLIFRESIVDNGVVGVWKTTEDDAFFENSMDFYTEELEELTLLKARKRSEWLSSRYLLHLLSERDIRGACLKDEYGKPYLKNSEYHISVSHSDDYTAVIGSPVVCGIDIQKIVSKIGRIARRFISDEEWEYIPEADALLYYHVLWGAKEAMYKCYGKKSLIFKENILVKPFNFCSEGFFLEGKVIKDNYNENYTLFCRQIDQLVLVYALQNT